MSTLPRSKLFRISLLASMLLTVSLALSPGASANERVPCPPGVLPIWARTGCPSCVIHDADWAAIPFYYAPEDVPDDFNLFTLVDFSLMGRGLTQNVTGFEVWGHWPPTTAAPVSAHWQGTGAVPVWFVPWGTFWAAAEDGVLTVPELEALPGLMKGTAISYKETLLPHEVMDAHNFLQQIQARGVLPDGRTFQVESTVHPPTGVIGGQKTRIVFR